MTIDVWFKNYWGQQDNELKKLIDGSEQLERQLKDIFDMGVAYGMDEIIARIKDKGNLDDKTEKELLERLDS